MGDAIQILLDRMVPGLEDLQEAGLFNRSEVKSIVSRRKDFEYLIKRRQPRKRDFLRYIQYELNLDLLLKMRRKKIQMTTKNWKKDDVDAIIVRHIHDLFRRTCAKFPGDVALWLQRIDFSAKQRSTKILSRIFAQALQLHPRSPGLWIKAASWEFFDSSNTVAARTLMQRALRINPSISQLWIQYYRLEWCYLQKLVGRQEILGLTEPPEEPENENHTEINDGLMIPLIEVENSCNILDFTMVNKAEKTKKEKISNKKRIVASTDETRSFYNGGVPLAIFHAACKALPDDLMMRREFLNIATVEFPTLGKDVRKKVYDSLERDFPMNVDAWCVRAEYPLLLAQYIEDAGADRIEECIQIYEMGVKSVEDPKIWVQYSKFLHSQLGKAGESPRALSLATKLDDVLARALAHLVHHQSLSTSDDLKATHALLTNQYAQLLLCSGNRVDDAKRVLYEGLAISPCNADIAIFLSSLVQRQKVHFREKGSEEAEKILRNSIKALHEPRDSNVPRIWSALIELLVGTCVPCTSSDADLRSKIKLAFHDAVYACISPEKPHFDSLPSFVQAYFSWMMQIEGLESATKGFKELLSSYGLRHPLLVEGMSHVFTSVIKAHDMAPSSERLSGTIRSLFEMAVDRCGTPEVWNAYREFELSDGNPQGAGAIIWRTQQLGIALNGS